MGTARTKGAVWAWLVVIGCIGFYSIPTGIIGNTSGIFVAPVMDQFGWTQTDTTMYRTIQPLVAAVCAPIAGKLMEKYNPRWILAAVSAAFGLASWASAYATELWQWNLYGVVYGVTSAFYMYLAAPVLINAWFKKSAGLAISITAATLSILAAVASPIGQELINQFGWQTARAALSIVTTVLSVVLTVAFVRKSPTVMGLLPFGAGEQDDAANQSAAPEPDEGATVAQAIKSPGLYLLILVACIFVMCAAFFQQIPAFAAHGALGASAGAMAVSIIMVGGVVFKLVLGALNDKIGVNTRASSLHRAAPSASCWPTSRARTWPCSTRAWWCSAAGTRASRSSRPCWRARPSARSTTRKSTAGYPRASSSQRPYRSWYTA